jgi:hypothetical protein
MKGRSSYDQLKEFKGKRYTGMAVGRSHKWRYDAGEWKERKVTPDRWEFTYNVVKRRAGKAPEGSGAPVGTAYHWYIVADQTVTKLDANSYMTEMTGHKIKVAHKRAGKSSWSASENAKRKHLAKQLRELAAELEKPVADEPATSEKPARTVQNTRSAHATTPRRRVTSHAPKRSNTRAAALSSQRTRPADRQRTQRRTAR